jgi:hypothetical protein
VGSDSDDDESDPWCAPAAAAAEPRSLAALLARRAQLCPRLRAAALFPRLAAVAHSCAPNCVVTFNESSDDDENDDDDDADADAVARCRPLRASLRAVCGIAAGEALTRAWVEEGAPLAARRAALSALGLPGCACDKCALDAASERGAVPLSYDAAAAMARRAARGCRPGDAAAAWRAAGAARSGDGDAAHGLGAALLNLGAWRDAAATWAAGAAAAPGHAALADIAAAAAALAPPPEAEAQRADTSDAIAWTRHAAGRGAAAHVSAAPVLSAAACAGVIAEAEAHAAARGGWATARHYAVPTTDVALRELPTSRRVILEALAAHVAPRAAACYGVPPAALRVHDAFVVRYDAAAGQASLPRHADQSVLSLTIPLNDQLPGGVPPAFTGGGTRFAAAGATLAPGAGHVVLFPGGLQHAGARISSGTRYIVAAFLWVDAAPAQRLRVLAEPEAPGDDAGSSEEEEEEEEETEAAVARLNVS